MQQLDAIEEVDAERARLDLALEHAVAAVTMRTSACSSLRPPSGRYCWSCRKRSSVTCAWRERVDLVEEERAAARELHQPGLACARVGEGAAAVAEELALDQRVGNGAAVHRHERPRGAALP